MTYLLDTHALLWAWSSPESLSGPVGNLILDRQNEILISAASAYEIASKVRLGKLPQAASLSDDFQTVAAESGFEILDITVEIALRAARLIAEHRDPFDRLLAATALEADIALLSRDSMMDTFGVRRIW